MKKVRTAIVLPRTYSRFSGQCDEVDAWLQKNVYSYEYDITPDNESYILRIYSAPEDIMAFKLKIEFNE